MESSHERALVFLACTTGCLALILAADEPRIPAQPPAYVPEKYTAAATTAVNEEMVYNAVPEVPTENLEAAGAVDTRPAPLPGALPAPEDTQASASAVVTRLENPYPFQPQTVERVNTATRGALVNILCLSNGDTVHPITASGVIIDPRGVILTNAHVGQYVLLQDASPLAISCTARFGSPASNPLPVRLLYMPTAWVNEHAHEIVERQPTGTGEHDYALLLIQSNRPPSFPALMPDVREAVTFLNDSVVVAGYPAGFLRGISASDPLHSVSTVAAIQDVFTFQEKTIDLVSLGGIIVAQSGSSGGAVVNMWNRLAGIVVTSSLAPNTAERDLRAITLAHVDRSIREETGSGLSSLLSGDLQAQSRSFIENTGRVLADQFMQHILPNR